MICSRLLCVVSAFGSIQPFSTGAAKASPEDPVVDETAAFGRFVASSSGEGERSRFGAMVEAVGS
jgi:hypothetical protein